MRGVRLSVLLSTVMLMGMMSVPAMSYGVNPQKRSPVQKVFNSPDHRFSFRYPRELLLCSSGGAHECASEAMLTACEEDALVCVVYRHEAFEGSHVDGAGFQVRQVPKDSADSCVTPEMRDDSSGYTVFQISAAHPVERIGSVTFVHGSDGQAALGTSSSTDYYRAYHRGRCYELSITTSGNSGGADDWGDDPESVRSMKAMRALDARYYRMVSVTLNEVLHSFRFTR